MKEIGGYIELEKNIGTIYHENAIALNCGRNCLAYLIENKNIKKIYLPYFLCDSVSIICQKYDIEIEYYHINRSFQPIFDKQPGIYEYLYIVNYYGQLNDKMINNYKKRFINVIIDNAQAYFNIPLAETDTIYTCRKFFGVSDGAFLYTNTDDNKELPIDESHKRMIYLLGRFEKTASDFYGEYVLNNKLFTSEPIKRISKLTSNLLCGIDYRFVKDARTNNYLYLKNKLDSINLMDTAAIEGAFMYPLLLENAEGLRRKLINRKIYVPILWPNVLEDVKKGDLEYHLAKDIIPLPVDQRYNVKDMEYLVQVIRREI